MTTIFNLAFVVFESAWRRAFGDDGFGLPLLKHRVVLHALNLVVLGEYLLRVKGLGLPSAIYCAAVIEVLFYSRTFWAGFDLGHSYPPTDAEKDAYGVIGKLLRRVFPERLWYRFAFDFAFMTVRYTYPLVMIVYFFNPLLLLVGPMVAAAYAAGWRFRPCGLVTELGEYCMGAFLALGLILT